MYLARILRKNRSDFERVFRAIVLPSRQRDLSTMVTQHIKKLCEDEDIVKSGQDKRCYRGLELTNGMKILLVSDPEADKSAASLDVHIGHMSDPKELPGLAHFCEHMLFLGTEKYPEENEYTKYLNEHGGCSNAFTSAEHTNFYFDVSPEHIGGALDRFSQFFLYPLFTPSATEREVNAVHLENEKNLPNDAWRLQQLNKSTSNPQHDFNKFGTGNKYTLETRPKEQGIDVRKELLHFHFKYYSSNIMTLAVVAKESVEELMEMIVPLFSCVENKNLTLPEWPIHPFGPEQLKVKVCAVPVKDIRNLAITWPIPDLQYYYKSQPGRYLSHLIGHEGPGSLLSELKARGWVNTLLGGQQTGAKGFMFFIVNVDLTEEGLEHVDSIVLLTFQYLNMLKKEGPKEWIFKECQNLNAMTFRFKDKEVSRSYVTSLSDHLSEYPMEDVLCGPYLLRDFRSDLIEMVLSKLLPETVRVAVIAKKFEGETNLKEEWYGTDYKIEKIPEETLESWRECGYLDNLKLPERNEFIPTNFDLYCKDEGVAQLPELIKDTTTSRLWYKQDTKFLLPKACLSFELRSPQAYMDPTQTDMTCLFVLLFKDALTEYAYAADIAGLHYNLENTIYGINLAIRGYNDKQHILLRKIMGKLTSFEVDPKRFEIMKEMYARGLRNFNAEQPHHHAVYYTSVLMSELLWTKEELLDALEDVTLDKLQAFIPLLLSKVFIEGLVYGNTTKQRALEMLAMMEQVLQEKVHTKPLLPSQHKFFRELQLPDGCHFIYKKVNEVFPSSCIEIYYQCDMQNTHSNMVLELFNQIFGEPFFNVLRTQEQLGYVIYSGVRRVSGVQGFRVIIQSDRSSDYVESRVEAFLFTIDEYLQNMTEEEFQRHIAALAAKMLEQPKKLSSQNMKYWSEITAQQYHFDRSNIEAAYLRTLTKDDLLGFYREKIAHNAPKRHKLSVHVVPAQSSVSDKIQDGLSTTDRLQPVEVTDLAAFKRHLALFPLPKPFIDIQKAKSKL